MTKKAILGVRRSSFYVKKSICKKCQNRYFLVFFGVKNDQNTATHAYLDKELAKLTKKLESRPAGAAKTRPHTLI